MEHSELLRAIFSDVLIEGAAGDCKAVVEELSDGAIFSDVLLEVAAEFLGWCHFVSNHGCWTKSIHLDFDD